MFVYDRVVPRYLFEIFREMQGESLTIEEEHGPCQVEADGQTTVLNPFSWNNISNSKGLPSLFSAHLTTCHSDLH